LLEVAAELGIVGLALSVCLVLTALRRRLPLNAASGTIRAVFLLLLIEAMVSGDIFSDRMTWGSSPCCS